MERERLIDMIESGKQVGISVIVKCNEIDVCYIYAIQKWQGRYLVYTDEVCLETMYANEMDDTEQVFMYDCFSEVMEEFHPKYKIQFEDLNVSKGQKFFNPKLYE